MFTFVSCVSCRGRSNICIRLRLCRACAKKLCCDRCNISVGHMEQQHNEFVAEQKQPQQAQQRVPQPEQPYNNNTNMRLQCLVPIPSSSKNSVNSTSSSNSVTAISQLNNFYCFFDTAALIEYIKPDEILEGFFINSDNSIQKRMHLYHCAST